MGLFDEPIRIDGKDIRYKRPKDLRYLDTLFKSLELQNVRRRMGRVLPGNRT